MKTYKSRQIMVGGVPVGGGAPITIQSMTTEDTSNVERIVRQILALEEAGCDISRSAINSLEDAKAIPLIKDRTNIPFIADIQFSADLALAAVEYDCDCLRINPGNIGGEDKLKKIVRACKEKKIPIRVGVNSGSVHQEMIEKYKGVNVESLVYSALDQVRMLESMDFYDMKVSIKSSDVRTMVQANELFASLSDYPLHLGVTEAGPAFTGAIKSSIGIGSLLMEGIGDTIRVSITGDPLQEVKIAKEILRSLHLRKEGIELISCPTCSRTKIKLVEMVERAEKELSKFKLDISVAIMGCPVNGPGEAKEADIGIAGARGRGVLFKKGKVIKQLGEDQLLRALIDEIRKMEQENEIS